MAEYVLTATKTEARAGSYYDRIERLYDLTFKLNGYGRSLDQYFEAHPLPVFENAKVLDAGCGTGTLTLTGQNSFTGRVEIQGGTVTFDSIGSLFMPSAFGMPFINTDPTIRVGLGSVWLSNLEAGNVWRLYPKRIEATVAF